MGIDTRNVSNGWLQPMDLRASVADELGADSTSPDGASRYSSNRTFVQLSPHYGPGQNTPKELAALRTTRTLHNLGRTAIFSNNPYVDAAIETLIPGGPAAMHHPLMAMAVPAPQSAPAAGAMQMGSSLGGLSGINPLLLFGRPPRRTSHAAAMQRTKRIISAGAPFRSEVPFADAVRVCNLAGDKTAMPALLHAYVFSKPGLGLAKLEYYADVLALQPPLIQLQVR